MELHKSKYVETEAKWFQIHLDCMFVVVGRSQRKSHSGGSGSLNMAWVGVKSWVAVLQKHVLRGGASGSTQITSPPALVWPGISCGEVDVNPQAGVSSFPAQCDSTSGFVCRWWPSCWGCSRFCFLFCSPTLRNLCQSFSYCLLSLDSWFVPHASYS